MGLNTGLAKDGSALRLLQRIAQQLRMTLDCRFDNSQSPVTRQPLVEHWFPATFRWPLVAGHSLLPVTNHQSLFTGHWPLVAGH